VFHSDGHKYFKTRILCVYTNGQSTVHYWFSSVTTTMQYVPAPSCLFRFKDSAVELFLRNSHVETINIQQHMCRDTVTVTVTLSDGHTDSFAVRHYYCFASQCLHSRCLSGCSYLYNAYVVRRLSARVCDARSICGRCLWRDVQSQRALRREFQQCPQHADLSLELYTMFRKEINWLRHINR